MLLYLFLRRKIFPGPIVTSITAAANFPTTVGDTSKIQYHCEPAAEGSQFIRFREGETPLILCRSTKRVRDMQIKCSTTLQASLAAVQRLWIIRTAAPCF